MNESKIKFVFYSVLLKKFKLIKGKFMKHIIAIQKQMKLKIYAIITLHYVFSETVKYSWKQYLYNSKLECLARKSCTK